MPGLASQLLHGFRDWPGWSTALCTGSTPR